MADAGTQYLPAGWTDEEKERAKNDVLQFLGTAGGVWLMNYVGCRKRLAEMSLLPASPGLQPHGAYIEGAARLDEMRSVDEALKHITDWRPTSGKN